MPNWDKRTTVTLRRDLHGALKLIGRLRAEPIGQQLDEIVEAYLRAIREDGHRRALGSRAVDDEPAEAVE